MIKLKSNAPLQLSLAFQNIFVYFFNESNFYFWGIYIPHCKVLTFRLDHAIATWFLSFLPGTSYPLLKFGKQLLCNCLYRKQVKFKTSPSMLYYTAILITHNPEGFTCFYHGVFIVSQVDFCPFRNHNRPESPAVFIKMLLSNNEISKSYLKF